MIPKELWPDNKGIITARIKEDPNTYNSWVTFWRDCVKAAPMVAIDLETDGLRPFHGSRLIGVAAAYYDKKIIYAGYWNFRHRGHKPHAAIAGKCPGYKELAEILPLKALKHMEPALKQLIIAGQNLKFDCKMWSVDGAPLPDRIIDTMMIAHLWDENKKSYSLDTLAAEIGEKKLGDSIKQFAAAHNIDINATGHAEIPYDLERPYAIADTILVLKRLQWERERWEAAEDPNLMKIFEIENKVIRSFTSMEIDGMKLDLPFIKDGVEQLASEMAELEAEIYKEAGKKFDILSLDQLRLVLEARGLKPLRFTPKGSKPSLTDFDLGQYHDALCELVKAYRARSKMHGTYFKPFEDTHADPSGFLHSDFFIHGTVSGRASCREPNLQNITRFEKFGTRTRTGSIAQAIREGVAKKEDVEFPHLEVRRCFIPRSKEHALFFYDYAQMELRVFAEYANEEFLLQALQDGQDIHAATASQVFPNFPKEEEDPKLYGYFRQLAKQINFGIIYGMGRNKLAVQLDVPVDETVRSLRMVQEAAAQGFQWKQTTSYALADIVGVLEDHRVMTNAHQWDGLRRLGSEVMHKVNPEPLKQFLFAPDRKAGNQRLMYSAETFLKNYHARFPKIKQFTRGIEQALKTRGYLFNKYGRRYHLPVEQAYVGVNRLVQGSCADMVKEAQVKIELLLRDKKTRMVNQVHDEIQIDQHHDELKLIPEIKKCMEEFSCVKVKMQVDADYSHTSWSDKRTWINEKEFKESLHERDKSHK